MKQLTRTVNTNIRVDEGKLGAVGKFIDEATGVEFSCNKYVVSHMAGEEPEVTFHMTPSHMEVILQADARLIADQPFADNHDEFRNAVDVLVRHFGFLVGGEDLTLTVEDAKSEVIKVAIVNGIVAEVK